MNTDYLHSEWVKMKISSIEEAEKQVRVSVSLKTSCIKVIDGFKTERGLFNGRSDFILAAIRHYYFSLIEEADSCIAERENGQSSDSIMKQLKKIITNNIETHLQAYHTIFEGDEKLQTSIYVSTEINDCLNDIQMLSGKRVGEFIQAAIASYCVCLFEKIHLRSEFVKSFNDL